jgi:hypothetical protein
MKLPIRILIPVFLFTFLQAISQDLREFETVDLTGYWQTDSAAQLGAKINGPSNSNSRAGKAFSADMDRAVISREYGFFDNGMFTAQWLLGTKPTLVYGTWGIVSRDKIFIEVDGNKTVYTVNTRQNDGIVLIPQRTPRGVIHELYFIKQEER